MTAERGLSANPFLAKLPPASAYHFAISGPHVRGYPPFRRGPFDFLSFIHLGGGALGVSACSLCCYDFSTQMYIYDIDVTGSNLSMLDLTNVTGLPSPFSASKISTPLVF